MKKILFPILLALLLTGNPIQAAAEGVSKQQAASIAQRQHPGRVLSIKRTESVYRVKMLTRNGEVRIILIDSNSGKVISGR